MLFSEYIRLKNADGNGYVKCITCNSVCHWKYADNGHYISRENLSTRWHEINCNVQCIACNRFKSGKVKEYRAALVSLYGESEVLKLEAMKKQMVHFTNSEGLDVIKIFTEKVNELKANTF